ncbi:MAG: nucleotidyltransferase family protein [Acidobacteria bacterium]|nr:nucleotidyltransferase family protein [Acidobacteriota bacterium]
MKRKSLKSIEEIEQVLKVHKRELRDKCGVKKIGIFGSYLRKENTKNSDIDILVEIGIPIGFLKFLDLERYLSHLLGVKVDLVTRNALKPHIGQRILDEVRYV